MNRNTLTRETLERVLDEAGLDPEDVVYNWPSGMYGGYGGHNSFALTGSDRDVALFFMTIGHMLGSGEEFTEGRSMQDLLPSGTDPLGRGSVTYFRGWQLEPEDEEG